MKSLLLTAAVSALALGATAQTKISIIPEAGVNLSNLRRTVNNEEFKSATNAGVRAGVNVALGLGNNLSIQPGIFFSQKGGHNSSDKIVSPTLGVASLPGGTTDFETRINYVEVPINAVYYFMDDQSGFFINAGAYFAAAVGGHEKFFRPSVAGGNTVTIEHDYTIGGTDPQFDALGNKISGDDIRRWDIGAQAGVGYQMRNGLMLRAQYLLGAMNITAHNSSANALRNGAINIGLGYKFGW